jgi:hypothetical protein
MNHLSEIGKLLRSVADYANFYFRLSTWDLALFRCGVQQSRPIPATSLDGDVDSAGPRLQRLEDRSKEEEWPRR